MKRIVWRMATLCMLLHSATRTAAGPIPIVNAGFEDPSTTVYTYSTISIPGWSFGGSGGGVWNINSDPLGFWSVPAPQGSQIGWLAPAFGNGSPASMSQILSATLQADTEYTLSGQVGHPIGFGSSLGTVFTAQLIAGSNVLASVSGTGPEGSFEPFQVTFDSSGSPYLGQTLEIVLSSSQAQTGFDEIALNAQLLTAAPEPAGFALFGIAVVALAGYRWRRGEAANS